MGNIGWPIQNIRELVELNFAKIEQIECARQTDELETERCGCGCRRWNGQEQEIRGAAELRFAIIYRDSVSEPTSISKVIRNLFYEYHTFLARIAYFRLSFNSWFGRISNPKSPPNSTDDRTLQRRGQIYAQARNVVLRRNKIRIYLFGASCCCGRLHVRFKLHN